MFDTRLIYQVVDWERRLEIENEKRKKPRPEPWLDFTAPAEPARQERESIFARLLRLGRSRRLAIRSVEPAGTRDISVCCETPARANS